MSFLHEFTRDTKAESPALNASLENGENLVLHAHESETSPTFDFVGPFALWTSQPRHPEHVVGGEAEDWN